MLLKSGFVVENSSTSVFLNWITPKNNLTYLLVINWSGVQPRRQKESAYGMNHSFNFVQILHPCDPLLERNFKTEQRSILH